MSIAATEKPIASVTGEMMHFTANQIMENNYYELHNPSARNGEEYDFETNYQNFEETVDKLKDLVVTKKPRMDKDVAKRFIRWISSISSEQDISLDEFRNSLGSLQIEQFNKAFMNRLDPITLIYEFHFFCIYCSQDDTFRKSCRQPDYIFKINKFQEPVWK